jgi:hypothetical protein
MAEILIQCQSLSIVVCAVNTKVQEMCRSFKFWLRFQESYYGFMNWWLDQQFGPLEKTLELAGENGMNAVYDLHGFWISAILTTLLS